MSNPSSTAIKAGKVTFVQTKLTWRIDKISEYCKASRIHSPVFFTKANSLETKWSLYLKLHKKQSQDSADGEQYLGIYLKSLNAESLRVTASCFFLNFSNTEVDVFEFVEQELKPQHNWGFSQFVKQKHLFDKTQQRNYTLDDSCTIVWTIAINEFIKVETKKDQIESERLLRLREFDKLGELLNDKRFSDVVIVVKGKEIYAHKNFLTTKSPVFEAMFTSLHLKEKVIKYIVDHGEDIAALPSFKKHCSELHADIVSDVFRAFAVKKRKIE